MPTTKLDVDLLPKLERLTAVLDDYDPVTQQKLLELASVKHAMRARAVPAALCVQHAQAH